MRQLSLTLIAAFTLLCNVSIAQLEVVFTGNPTVQPGGQVTVDVSVNNWNDLIGVQFSMNWDSLVLQYNSTTNFIGNPPVDYIDISTIGDPSAPGVNPGQATFSWFALNGDGWTAPDGSVLFTLVFDAIGQACNSTDLVISGDPRAIEVSLDDANNTNIGATSSGLALTIECMPMDCGPNNGNPSCGGGNDPNGTGATGSDEIAASGENVCVEVSVDNFSDIQSFNLLNINWDPNLLSFTGTQNYCQDVPGLGASLFGTTNVATGQLTLAWFDGSGMNPITLPNGKVLFEMCFDAVGANGTYADIMLEGVEFGNSMGQALPFFSDCGSVEICTTVVDENLTLIAEDISFSEDDDICIPVTVQNFNMVGSFQFNMDWDEAFFQYTGVQNVNPLLLQDPLFNIDAQGFLTTNWFHPQGANTTLADDDILFEVCFDFIGACDNSSFFNFVSSNTVNIEFGDENDQPIVPVDIEDSTVTIDCPDCNFGFNATNPGCAGETGSIQLTGDVQSCVWTYEGTTFNNPNGCSVAAGLPGVYCVTITDSNNEMCNDCVTLTNPTAITFDTSVEDIGCDGTGQINVDNIMGGSGGYSVNPTAPVLVTTPGDFIITVSDSNGCSSTESVTVGENIPALEATGQVTQGCEGSIVISISGGCSPYTVTPTGGTFNAAGDEVTYSNLPPGSYLYTINDDAGNSIMTPLYTIDAIDALSADQITTTGSCDNASGSAKITMSGGCTPYSGGANSTTVDNVVCFNNLSPGNYTETITDDAGNSVEVMFTIDVFDAPTITPVIVNATIGMSDGMIDLGILGGTPPYTITIDPSPPTVMINGSIISGLPAGMYVVTVTDANDCEVVSGSLNVGENNGTTDSLIVNITVTSEDNFNGSGVSCNGECDGSVSTSVNGVNGSLTLVEWTDEAGVVISNDLQVDMLCAGSYTLNLEDEAGLMHTETVVVTEPDQISISIDVSCADDPLCNGLVDVSVDGGTEPYSYVWSTGADTEDLPDACVGTYVVIVTDANGCEDMVQNIQVDPCDINPECEDGDGPCYSTYGNIITPDNQDGANDFLNICCAGDRDNTFAIYDRWGREVFGTVNYNNTWNGVDENGEFLNEGTYFWIMEVTFETEEVRIFKGYVTILRDL